MNIYLVSQTLETGYDTYDSFVAIAANDGAARRTYPGTFNIFWKDGSWRLEDGREFSSGAWPEKLRYISVELLGKAKPNSKPGVVCSSFNAG